MKLLELFGEAIIIYNAVIVVSIPISIYVYYWNAKEIKRLDKIIKEQEENK